MNFGPEDRLDYIPEQTTEHVDAPEQESDHVEN